MTPEQWQAVIKQIDREMDEAFLRNVTRDLLNRGEPLKGDFLAFVLAAIKAFDFDREGHLLPPRKSDG